VSAGCEHNEDALIGLFEGTLDPAATAEAQGRIQACSACRAEYEWLVSVASDLEAIGANVARQTPTVDLTSEVMARINSLAAPTIVPMRPTRRASFPYAGLIGLAAAAAIAVFFWFAANRDKNEIKPSILAQNDGNGTEQAANSMASSTGLTDETASAAALQKAIELLHRYDAKPSPTKGEFLTTAPPDLHALTTSDVITTTRAAVTDPDARNRLQRWASLSPEQAKQVAEAPSATPGAIIGASATLDPTEATPLLLTALGAYADKPAANMALSKAYLNRMRSAQDAANTPDQKELKKRGTDASNAEDAMAAVENWINADPKNALAYCVKALLLLDQPQPDVTGAAKVLAQAKALPTASAYGLENTAFTREALVAAGMDPDTATALTAMTAGRDQHDFLMSFSQELLDKAKQSMAQGDTQTAQTIAESVQQLGTQLDQGAQLSQERLAALEMQRDAITLLQSIYTSLGSTSDIQELTVDTQKLASGMENLSGLLADLGNLFLGATDQVFGLITNIIHRTGDLTLFEHLPS